jgi:ADP-dependent NAD(P)H-hydrate dehydratase / NAD(P)H-hydrate epimerase
VKPDFERFLIGPRTMAMVDADAASGGINSFLLMKCAGEAVAAVVLEHYPSATRCAVLCGPGNNGGDGYVAASALSRAGCDVEVFGLGEIALKGDAALARALWPEPVAPLGKYAPRSGDVIIDALFGAGLSRDVPTEVSEVIAATGRLLLPVVAADVPSGLDGETGEVRGAAFSASHTVTFMARKPGHLLLPGRELCGHLHVADIGIPQRLLAARAPTLWENGPEHFAGLLSPPAAQSHKYTRGHVAVFSGGGAQLRRGKALGGGSPEGRRRRRDAGVAA